MNLEFETMAEIQKMNEKQAHIHKISLLMQIYINQPVSSATKHNAIHSGGLQIDFPAGHITHSVPNSSTLLQRFFGAVQLRH